MAVQACHHLSCKPLLCVWCCLLCLAVLLLCCCTCCLQCCHVWAGSCCIRLLQAQQCMLDKSTSSVVTALGWLELLACFLLVWLLCASCMPNQAN
ncbi:hypothetical protein COO60DRAFT_552067 [Scenedesmus sp. NREL 46B-D3]|nr:hypothetical protein COO60DRAFT_552067 [Scenedesmus sp. NREL 46B-D3]